MRNLFIICFKKINLNLFNISDYYGIITITGAVAILGTALLFYIEKGADEHGS